MPIDHPTLVLAKNHAERLHNGGGKDYSGGHGIVVDGEYIKVDTAVVAEQTDIQDVTASIQTVSNGLNSTNQTLTQTNQTLAITQQGLSTLEQSTATSVTQLTTKDTDLQTQIDNIKNGITAIPVATAGKPGIVMPRQGLSIDSSGALNATLQEYLDMGTGRVFLDHKESKVIKLFKPCYSIYLEFYLIDTVNVAGSNSLFMNTASTAETITKGYLTATFSKDGNSISLTNNHTTNAMFVSYGCADFRS